MPDFDVKAETTKVTLLTEQAMHEDTRDGARDAWDLVRAEIWTLSGPQLRLVAQEMDKRYEEAVTKPIVTAADEEALGRFPEMRIMEKYDASNTVKGVTLFEHVPGYLTQLRNNTYIKVTD